MQVEVIHTYISLMGHIQKTVKTEEHSTLIHLCLRVMLFIIAGESVHLKYIEYRLQ